MQELKINGVYKHYKGDLYIVEILFIIAKQEKNGSIQGTIWR